MPAFSDQTNCQVPAAKIQNKGAPLLVLVHEFFGLSEAIARIHFKQSVSALFQKEKIL